MRGLRPFDSVTILFLGFLSLFNLLFHARIPEWWILISLNIAISFFIILVALRWSGYSVKDPRRLVRDWYPIVVIPGIFKELYYMVYPIRQLDYDDLLIEIDQLMFGVNPTEWLAQFSHPLLTEFLQIVYATFYFLLIIASFELYRKRMMKEFYFAILLITYGFYLSFIGYFLVPAIGPRFTLHDFHRMSIELPGLLLTDVIRDLLNAGESIPHGVPNPEHYVQRDVFPSAHTQLTLVVIYISVIFKLRTRQFLWITGSLLIFSTVYLWYHYVIDVIAGAVFFILTVKTGPYIGKLLTLRPFK